MCKLFNVTFLYHAVPIFVSKCWVILSNKIFLFFQSLERIAGRHIPIGFAVMGANPYSLSKC